MSERVDTNHKRKYSFFLYDIIKCKDSSSHRLCWLRSHDWLNENELQSTGYKEQFQKKLIYIIHLIHLNQ